MENFAKQNYYDQIIAKAQELGFRFVKQVAITTDDMPYFIEAKNARNTNLVFDVPGKAAFIHFDHNEMNRSEEKDSYENWWSLRAEFCYLSDYQMLDLYVEKMKESETTVSEWDFENFIHPLDAFELNNLRSGWSSRGSDGERIWTGDIDHSDHEVMCPLELIYSVLEQISKRPTEHLAEKFESLEMLWAPQYTFTGKQEDDYVLRNQREKQLENIYWERFGDARSIIRDKVIRAY